jgi:lipoprotein-anchoring transpeptidase ErfK/SrfK
MWTFAKRAVIAFGIALAPLLPAQASGANLELDEPLRPSLEIVIEKAAQEMAVYVDGALRQVFPVSTGTRRQPTPSGTFRPLFLTRMAYAPKYDNAPMPFSIFFTRHGHAIHATGHLKTLGRPVSHGCVRLTPEAAEWLYALVQHYGKRSTTIRVY